MKTTFLTIKSYIIYLKTFILLKKKIILFWFIIGLCVAVGVGLGILVYKITKNMPEIPEYPVPGPEMRRYRVEWVDFDNREVRRLILPQFPKDYPFPQGGVVVKDPACPHGSEVFLPGESRLDKWLAAAELRIEDNRTYIQYFSNIRRLASISEISHYLNDKDFFVRTLFKNDAFCFFNTFLEEKFPGNILTDKYGRIYYIINIDVYREFTHAKEYTLELFKILCNGCDFLHYGMFGENQETVRYIIEQNEKAFAEQLVWFSARRDVELAYVLLYGFTIAACIITGCACGYIIS